MGKTMSSTRMGRFRRQLPLHLMLIPGLIFIIIFNYVPLAGLKIAFEKFIPAKGLFGNQQWVGFKNFVDVFNQPNFKNVMYNTVFISVMKIILSLVVPIIIALMLNEVRHLKYRKLVQTMIFIPFFISWVTLGGIFIDILSPNNGAINHIIQFFGGQPIYFLGDTKTFPYVMAVTDCWKGMGYNTIVYTAAMAGIDPGLYEAAAIDGAGRWKRMWHITLPGIKTIIVLLTVLGLGNVLNAGFDQIYMMYSPQVYETGDVLDTLVYRLGLKNFQYGLSTAVGLFKSVISSILIGLSYFLAYRFADYRLF